MQMHRGVCACTLVDANQLTLECCICTGAGTMIVCHLQGVHNQWQEPTEFKPERFMPGGEYDQFEESVRSYMFVPFIQVCLEHVCEHESDMCLLKHVQEIESMQESKCHSICDMPRGRGASAIISSHDSTLGVAVLIRNTMTALYREPQSPVMVCGWQQAYR